MFTGLIEEIGTITGMEEQGDSLVLSISAPALMVDVKQGDSISVNGVCLTVVIYDATGFTADVMKESLDRSSLGQLRTGSNVNLERAMRADARMGGHIVQGHVDGTGVLLSRDHSEHWDVLRFSLPADISQYVVEKGSIAVDGTSLTVSSISEPLAENHWFEVSLIPTTLERTTLGELKLREVVNLEVDIVGKYVERMLAGHK